jgi:uncharacterized protein
MPEMKESVESAIRPASPDDDFTLQEAMIPVRDGVELHTLILAPKDVNEPLPMLLLRTPYDASKRMPIKQRTELRSVMGPGLADLEGFIFVMQDIRGQYGSGGIFELNRAPRGDLNNTDTDETTDAWDTIDWLVKNVPNNNGKVGIFGTSYEGWTTLMALLDPHPALRVAVPVNPLVDGWIGDDWFHNGAFRLPYAFEYIYMMESDPKTPTAFPYSEYDTYSWWLKAGSPMELGKRYLDKERHRFWNALMENPEYTGYWRKKAVDAMLKESKAPLIPTMYVHSWFDQEDIYGAPVAYAVMKERDTADPLIYFAAGPWYHGQTWARRDTRTVIGWDEDAAKIWRAEQLAPFLGHYLKDGPPHGVAPVNVFNTGSRRWERLDAWPISPKMRRRSLYLSAGNKLSWNAPRDAKGSQSFVSDPKAPVPYQPRPARRIFMDELNQAAWRTWQMMDQRFVDGRPDVLTYVSERIEEPVTIRGDVTAKIFAETTGSDADWVVKLIDVFPDHDPSEWELSGYQLMISGEIFRGRYRTSFETPEEIKPNEPLEYTIRMPQVNHTFLKGHYIMVQVQSTWFPLYDRNPQRFIPSIMDVKPEDYQTATHRVHSGSVVASRIDLTVDD